MQFMQYLGYRFSLILFIIANNVNGQNQALNEQLDSLMNAYHKSGYFNGAVLITLNHEPILESGYGFANHEWNIPNSVRTKFKIASLSKQFTAFCILQLEKSGLLLLDDPIDNYIPELGSSSIGIVTISQALYHSSGIQRDIFETDDEAQIYQSKSDILNKMAKMKLQFEPGSKVQYSNAAYHLLAIIIENVTSKSFDRALDSLIFEPLGMFNSGYWHSSKVIEKSSTGYDILLGQAIKGTPHHHSVSKGAGGIYTTIEDMVIYDSYLNKKLDPSIKKKMKTPGLGIWGIGWKLRYTGDGADGQKQYLAQMSGDAGGFASHYLWYENDGLSIILLSNQDLLPREHIVGNVLNIINQSKPQNISPNYADSVFIKTITQGVKSGVALAKQLSKEKKYQLNVIRANFCANQLFKVGKIEQSKLIHRLIIAYYPDHWMGYAGLGLVLKNQGLLKEAKHAFKEGLKQSPDNRYLLEFLDELKNR